MEIIQMKFDNNPNYIIDQILHYELKKKNKYPDMSTVVNDPLRSQLQKYFGINLSMCDTHSYILGNYHGICTDDKYFIYAAPMKELEKILSTQGSYHNEEAVEDYKSSSILKCRDTSWFPEGVFLGVMPTELIDDDQFRNEHMGMYCCYIYDMYINMARYMREKRYFDSDIINIYHFFFKCKLYLDGGVSSEIDHIYCDYRGSKYFTTSALKEHEKEFRSAYLTYNYADYEQFFRKYGVRDITESI